jgi:hypothetical protein
MRASYILSYLDQRWPVGCEVTYANRTWTIAGQDREMRLRTQEGDSIVVASGTVILAQAALKALIVRSGACVRVEGDISTSESWAGAGSVILVSGSWELTEGSSLSPEH